MHNHAEILAKSDQNKRTSLYEHLQLVAQAAEKIAKSVHLDAATARMGAILHDIGKAHPVFQQRLGNAYNPLWTPFRHEIASLLFLPLVPAEQPAVIEMIVAHHKSVRKDARELGILDLYDRYECDGGELFSHYFQDFAAWSSPAFEILAALGLSVFPFSKQESEQHFYQAISYCRKLPAGWSAWKGLLIGADHLASALQAKTEHIAPNLFTPPNLTFYHRKSTMHPLSLLSAASHKKHTLVTAPTGAGKTDFLLRRCRGRVFYTLPFQASINAMYKRLQTDLQPTAADIRLLHASSEILVENGQEEERVLQGLMGASIKVLTPHQLAAIVFGTRGYETVLLDLQGCDVILDEIHTFNHVSQAIVLELVQTLQAAACRLHIGTATMPGALKDKILSSLGADTDIVELAPEKLDAFDRHQVHKIASFADAQPLLEQALAQHQKILVVANQVKRAQALYRALQERFTQVNMMLLHSRFKRGDRARLEADLQQQFNLQSEACIVVATQVVEVSLDISFDLLITECAPIDSLIQRFGRINRSRQQANIGKLKPVYVLAPSTNKIDALPYEHDILQKSYEVLPDNAVLHERNVQNLLDAVYPTVDITPIAGHVIYKNGNWLLPKLQHRAKSVLMDMLEIDSVVCICEQDETDYTPGNKSTQISMEIPVSFKSVAYKHLRQLKYGHRPFVIPDAAYDAEMGLDMNFAAPQYYTDNFL